MKIGKRINNKNDLYENINLRFINLYIKNEQKLRRFSIKIYNQYRSLPNSSDIY